MEKIILKEEKETLLIPLYGKAMESKKRNPLIRDIKGMEIIERIAYPFEKLHIPEKTNIMMSMRAAMLDRYAEAFIQQHPNSMCLHLGCGLDSRYMRIQEIGKAWIDVDFPEVIELRRKFYQETERYHMVGSSVTESAWIDHLSVEGESKLVIAEGLLMYLSEEEIFKLIARLREKIGPFTFIFDAYSNLTAKHAAKHPSLKKTGAEIKWGLDDERELTARLPNLVFQEERYFLDPVDLDKLSSGMRFMFRLSGHFRTARNAHRIMIFEVK